MARWGLSRQKTNKRKSRNFQNINKDIKKCFFHKKRKLLPS